MNPSQLQNLDLLKQLESKAVEIEVKETDKTRIELAVISANDVQQATAPLGIDVQ